MRIIVVDDASTDGAVEKVVAHFPGVEALRNEKNLGFGATCNRGIQQAIERGKAACLTLATVAVETLSLFGRGHPRAAWHLASSIGSGLR